MSDETMSILEQETEFKEDLRRKRYIENLENLETMEIEQLYPPEIRSRQWEAVTDEHELKEFMSIVGAEFTNSEGKFVPQLMGVFRDPETGQKYAVPTFGGKYNRPREILLDMMATAKELAPWAKFNGLTMPQGSQWFTRERSMWSFSGDLIIAEPSIVEGFVNGLGDQKYSDEEKVGFLLEDTAAIVHESVHINNGQDLDFGGPARVVVETASITSEYLAFPGRNKKMEAILANASHLLKGEEGEYDVYDEALLVGVLSMLNEENSLPQADNPDSLEQAINDWRDRVVGLSSNELADYRNKMEQAIFLSAQDEKLRPKLAALCVKYPKALGHLSVMQHIEKNEDPTSNEVLTT